MSKSYKLLPKSSFYDISAWEKKINEAAENGYEWLEVISLEDGAPIVVLVKEVGR
jgi:hypothetical protein